jgi:hypothetical protein
LAKYQSQVVKAEQDGVALTIPPKLLGNGASVEYKLVKLEIEKASDVSKSK